MGCETPVGQRGPGDYDPRPAARTGVDRTDASVDEATIETKDFPPDWVCPDRLRIPDFIICGAMKSGTSTLHHILDHHPDVFIAAGEIHFFDIDSLVEHPDFTSFDGRNWVDQRLEDDPVRFWNWYAAHFEGAAEGQLVGEDSTTHLASEDAAKRIGAQGKPIRLLVMLRHPTQRTYSQYWHYVRTGRATHGFEATLRYNPLSLLGRSLYRGQLERLFRYVPRERVLVIVFEEFLERKEDTLRRVCDHLGLDFDRLPINAMNAHLNRAQIPRFPSVQLLKNRYFPDAPTLRYAKRLPGAAGPAVEPRDRALRWIERAHRRLNPLTPSKPPPMHESTRAFLDEYFSRRLEGLDDLVGADVLSRWFDREVMGE